MTSLTYDNNGNRSSLTFPNAVTTDYTYDDLNRRYPEVFPPDLIDRSYR